MMKQSTSKRNTTERPLLGVVELAERLGTSERFVRRLIGERRIPFHKVGKYVRFDQDDVDDWVARGRVEAMRWRRDAHSGSPPRAFGAPTIRR